MGGGGGGAPRARGCLGAVVAGRGVGGGAKRGAAGPRLRESGCDTMQGFLFAKPGPAEAVVALIRRHASRAA